MDLTKDKKQLHTQIENLSAEKEKIEGIVKNKDADLKEKTDLLEKQKNTIEYLRNETVGLRTEITRLTEDLDVARAGQ